MLQMPQCSVPGCHTDGGHRFPKDCDGNYNKAWLIAIKRLEPTSGSIEKLWVPSKNSLVCHLHFKPSDYTPTLLGKFLQ